MKYLLLTLSLVPLGLYAAEEDPVFQHPVKPEALKGLHEIFHGRMGTNGVLRSKMNQTKTIPALKFPLNTTGRMLFDPETGVALIVETPFPAIYLMTTNTLTLIDQEGRRQSVPVKQNDWTRTIAETLLAVLGGDTAKLAEFFNLHYQEQQPGWVLGLKPEHPRLKKSFDTVVLSGNKKELTRFLMHEKGGGLTDIRFSEMTVGKDGLSKQEKILFHGEP